MDTATEPTRTLGQGNKRVRFSDPKQRHQPTDTPMGRAKFVANVTLASLPLSLKPLAEQASRQYLSDLAELLRLAQNKAKLTNADFLPISARVKFKLGVTTRVLEAFADEHKQLTTHVDTAVDIFHATLKTYITQAIDLEMKAMKAAFLKHLCNTLGSLGTCYTIHANKFDELRAPYLVYVTLDAHHESLLKHTGFSKLEVFAGLHDHVWPALAPYDPDIADVHQDTVSECLDPFSEILAGLLVRPWDAYQDRVSQQNRDLKILKFIEEKKKRDATEDTVMDLEEIPADGATIREVALAETRKENKTLKTQIDRLTQQMRSLQKNLPSGAPPTKGSRQTKNGVKPSTPGRKAVAADNGSTAANKPSRGKKKSPKPRNSTSGKK
jgi:hypothetical protein